MPDSAVQCTGDGYSEWPVHPALARTVVCAWRNHTDAAAPVVLPDACIDLIWDGRSLLVAGPDTGPVAVDTGATYAGIRFRPGAAPGFLGLPACEIRDQRLPLADIWGRAADELAERLAGAAWRAHALLEAALLARLPEATPPDPLVTALFQKLGQSGASDRAVQSIARRLAIPERTLRRRSAAAIGYGPKTLDRILRFRRALRLGHTGWPLLAVAALAGYTDQAHLNRECRRLAGTTPVTLFKSAVIVSAND